MTENKQFIFDSIYNQVRMGFRSLSEIKDAILEEIEDNGFEEEISESWAFQCITEAYDTLLSESKHCSHPTDTEKLIKAFDELCAINIIALHNAGYTTSDGEYEVVEIEKALRQKQSPSEGYCFYHEQDLSRAITPENSSLYIAYQKIENTDDSVTLKVGQKVVEILTKNGLKVEWKDDVNSKILLPDFKWQHLYDDNNRDLQDYEDTLDLLLKPAQPITEPNATTGFLAKIRSLLFK